MLVLLLINDDSGLAQVWDGTADFAWGSPTDYLTMSPLTGGSLADVDNDAFVDLVAATGGPAISVLLGDGEGGFACERIHETILATSIEVLAAGEIDGDGGAEVVVGGRNGSTVMVFRAL